MHKSFTNADKNLMNTSYGIIWKILNILDLALDYKELPKNELVAQKFKITENRFFNYLVMLQNAGYITGLQEVDDICSEYPTYNTDDVKITLQGIQFLLENSMMNKIAKQAKELGLKVAEFGFSTF